MKRTDPTIAPGQAVEIVRDGEPQLRHAGRFLKSVGAERGHFIELTRSLLRNNLRARYRQSVLGYVWLLITPVATAAVWMFLHSAGVIRFGATATPYPVYVTTGVFLWSAFLKMLNAPLQQLDSSRRLLTKIKFPWEALIAAGWGEAVVEILVYFAVLLVVYLAYGISPAGILLSIPLTVMLLLLGGGLGLLLTPFGVLYQDIPRALGVGTFLLFFLTPIVYPVPTTMPGQLIFLANPVAILLAGSREVMTAVPLTHPSLVLGTSAAAVILFGASWLLFRVSIPHIVSKL